ncbi:hypothetical protein D9M71_737600 [compost metagenome]
MAAIPSFIEKAVTTRSMRIKRDPFTNTQDGRKPRNAATTSSTDAQACAPSPNAADAARLASPSVMSASSPCSRA